jgi:integrase
MKEAKRERSRSVPGQGRIYKRGAVWYIDYWVDGMRKREKASGDKQAALEALAAKTTDVKRGALGFEKKQVVHFSDFADEYLKIKAEKRSIRSIRGYVKHLKASFGELPLSRITPELVEQYKQKRLKDKIDGKKKTARTMKGPSINRELAILKNLFNVAKKMRRFRGEIPVESISYCPEQPRDYVLSKEEIGRLLAAAGESLKKIILIALNTGLRKGEILSLRWSQVNLDEKIISFARTKSVKFLRIPINAVVEGVLSSIERTGDYVFPGRWGKGHLADSKLPFNAARKAAGLPDLHFHDLRHCAGTYMAAAGVPLTTIQQILGHSDIRTTNRYVNPNDENRRKAVDALAAVFMNPQKSAGPENGGTNVAQAQIPEDLTLKLSAN